MAAANGGGNPQTGPGSSRWSRGPSATAARDGPDPCRSGVCYALLYLVVSARVGLCRDCDKAPCIYGRCVNGSCLCDQGWVGEQCQHCGGRFKLTEPSGYLTDGPINYKYKTKCTWLIEGHPNAVLRLRFNHFATECSWDHMYVYDGDSIYAPLIAVFSGLIVPEVHGNETVPEVVTTSGYALLHFFSDAAYNLTGFNIFYSINSCPNNCSGHGKCVTGSNGRVFCECDKYWKGEACDIPYCKDNCGSPDHGYCDLTGEKLCVCNDSWQGPDCSLTVPSMESYWVLTNIKPFSPSVSRASHKAVVYGKFMWVIGGYTFNYSSTQMVLKYDLESSGWTGVPITSIARPPSRYGHSLTLYQDDIYMYGGKVDIDNGNITNELWIFNIPTLSWTRKIPTVLTPGQQYDVEGHSAHIIEMDSGDVIMIIIFGYSALYGYINSVQEYNIKTNTWFVSETKGAIVQGGYGHSSVYNAMTKSIYVHGGYKAFTNNKYGLVDDLYKYTVYSHTWTILKESGFARYLHSAVIISGAMLIFGGNTHNDTSLSNGAKCFSGDFLAYDIGKV
ncbi:attractin-like protein 1 isoform X4 [Scyliorhinus canicula]|uniref:attractin-like protein 1 isoform X4 n=1 Tax=Scyliorhinus canicula TaxID=7830 RepID=UPI0018F42642|nr:attractin-like protein 1 isoform X4 [Scyliorhinus canicula]